MSAAEAMKPKPKFKVGQRVYDKSEQATVTILDRLHDPSDGWEYQTVKGSCVWRFEADLRPLTKRERGK